MTNLFGTDGIRGEAGVSPLDAKTVFCVGRALARNLKSGERPRLLIGRDTRSSGTTIESWLAAGIAAGGGEAITAGVIGTPGVAHLTRHFGFAAGVVISASHNPFPDNGVKIFSTEGKKASEDLETTISKEVSAELAHDIADDEVEEKLLSPPDPKLQEEYLRHLRSSLPSDIDVSSLKIGLDCANGATYQVGPRLLEMLDIGFEAIGVTPDGRNINDACGSTHPEQLAKLVQESNCHFGAALDGDGDRLLLVDGDGQLINGDAILLMCARHMKSEQRLPGPGIVATVMSNLALEQALESEEIGLFRTKVGDKYVAKEMEKQGLVLGGEQSGHIIFSDYSPTGDGLLTLLQILRVVASSAKPLNEIAHLKPFPQVLVNVPVREKRDVQQVPEIAHAMEEAERQMAGRGRLLVRFSGTEPLLRIMMEGPDEGEIRALTASIAEATRRSLAE